MSQPQPPKIRTTRQFFAALGSRVLESLPEGDETTGLGELANHVKRSTQQKLSGALTAPGGDVIDVEGESVSDSEDKKEGA